MNPNATCSMKTVEHMIWPYDDQGRLIGEDAWDCSESFREIIPLDPHESSRSSRRQVARSLIKRLPEQNPFTDWNG